MTDGVFTRSSSALGGELVMSVGQPCALIWGTY